MKKMNWEKCKHFFIGITIGVVTQALIWWFLPPQIKLITVVSLMLIMVLNFGFDLFSKIKGKGGYELLNIAAGTIGGAVGIAVILIVQFH
jgi:hypothetical protein